MTAPEASGEEFSARISDTLPVLLPAAASLLVLVAGWGTKVAVLDPVLAQSQLAAETRHQAELTLYLVLAVLAILAFALGLIVVYQLNRPVHELAESIALAGMTEVPKQVPVVGPRMLRLVAERYNRLVDEVARYSDALAESADHQRHRAEMVEGFSDRVLAGVPSGIVAVNMRSEVVRLNAAARQILGLEGVAAEGLPIDTLLPPAHPVARAAHVAALRDEVSVRGAAGEQVLGVSSGEVQDAAGRVVGRVVIFADLTALRALEQKVELSQRLASLGELAAGLAHEVRNPLGALRGFVELLERHLDDPERATPLLQKIQREADTLGKVVGDFLDFARPAAPRREQVILHPLLVEVLEAGACAAGVTPRQTEVRVDPADLQVMADQSQLRRALLNFALNACQAAGPQGSLIAGAEPLGDRVRVYVQDDGPGVEPALRDKLGTPFFTTKTSGTGLGLAVAHQIARGHGGELLHEVPAGGGARFVLVLPRA